RVNASIFGDFLLLKMEPCSKSFGAAAQRRAEMKRKGEIVHDGEEAPLKKSKRTQNRWIEGPAVKIMSYLTAGEHFKMFQVCKRLNQYASLRTSWAPNLHLTRANSGELWDEEHVVELSRQFFKRFQYPPIQHLHLTGQGFNMKEFFTHWGSEHEDKRPPSL